MNLIWANQLIAGTKTWAEMPASFNTSRFPNFFDK